MQHTDEHRARLARIHKWFAPARFGMFYHWGLYTGGGSTGSQGAYPLFHKDIASLEKAVPDPAAVMRNMAGIARTAGAKYATLTALHTGDGFALMYPSKHSGIKLKTNLDYTGAFIDECARQEIKPLLYFPAGPGTHWDSPGGPWLDETCRDNAGFAKLMRNMIAELAEQHGDRLGGFWMDGINEDAAKLAAFMHEVLPNSIFIINNCTKLDIPSVDYGTTEFLTGPADPPYCRPSGLARPNPRWRGILVPPHDCNEDIPSCNGWWYTAGPEYCSPGRWQGIQDEMRPYLEDSTFFVKQMVSSLGQRGQWNFALGIGPRADGTLPPEFEPMFKKMAGFMEWGSESIYRTTGGEGSAIDPGWTYGDGFASVTVSLDDPTLHYVHITTAPAFDELLLQSNGYAAESVTDLRTGRALAFENRAGLRVTQVDWSDVRDYGDKVFKVRFRK